MADVLYTIHFSGEVARGNSADEVRRKLATVPGVPREGIEDAFRGHPLTIRDLSRDDALKIVNHFEAAGALCRIDVQRGPAASRPPQRPAVRPPQRPATTSTATPAPPSASPSPRPPAPDRGESSAETTITCAKCGMVQPRGTECIKCGVLFDKIETVTELANDPELIAGELAERYRPRLRSPHVFLTPRIPREVASRVLTPYFHPEVPWREDLEFIINADEELIATFDNPEDPPSRQFNLLLTNLKILVSYREETPLCTGFDLWSLKNIEMVGQRWEILVVDDVVIRLPDLDEPARGVRREFIKMAGELVRALKQADRAARLKAKRAWQENPHQKRLHLELEKKAPDSGKPRVTLEKLDLRELEELASRESSANSEDRKETKLLSNVKSLFKKK